MAKFVVEMFALLLVVGLVQQLSAGSVIDRLSDFLLTDLNEFHFLPPNVVGRSSMPSDKYCMPKVFQYNAYNLEQKLKGRFCEDGDNTRVFHSTTKDDGKFEAALFLFHPQTHKCDAYTFNNSTCKHITLHFDYPGRFCFPTTTTMHGPFNLGITPGGITAQLLTFRNEFGEQVDLLATLKECLPIVVSVKGQTAYYSDLSLTITDPSVFTPPKYCPP
jgi:hypothetical protein